MMGMHSLRGVQGEFWLAQWNDSLHIGFGESEKSWKAPSREQIRQLSSFRWPPRIGLFSNTACSMLLSLLPATLCSKCDTSHHLLTETRSGVSSHEKQTMLCHPEKPLLQGWTGVTTPMLQTYQPSAGPQIPAVHKHAEPHPATSGWIAMSCL